MTTLLAAAQIKAPVIDYKELSPLFALAGGCVVVLMVGLFSSRFVRRVIVPILTALALLTAIGLTIWIWEPGNQPPIVEGALKVDALSLGIAVLFYTAGLVTIVLSLRSTAVLEAGQGEFYSMLLGSITGMVVLAESNSRIRIANAAALVATAMKVVIGVGAPW